MDSFNNYFFLFSSLSFAEENHRFPEQLFGITLGGIYDIGEPENKDLGNIPVEKFTGITRFLGQGIHYYFKPKKQYKQFDYIEKEKKPEDHFFETSFRLYLLPIIPASVSNKKQLENTKIKWEVALIEWSSNANTKENAYWWAFNLCETFEADLSVKPKITDSYDKKEYQCVFSYENRAFKVSSIFSKRVELSYTQEKKDDAVEKKMRKLQANEIRPY